ncbi:MAG: TauD/TfdA family dioxygenase [Gammaproteobacteria bacterium]|nr:TauD/TfdA family dioxygenase [Gammaproteobacteria bacterium]
MSAGRPIERLDWTARRVALEWAGGARAEFASLWLRDNRREDRDPHSDQRLIDVVDLPERPRIRSARLADGSLVIEWQDGAAESRYEGEWLLRHSDAAEASEDFARTPWLEGAGLDATRDFAWLEFAALSAGGATRAGWLARLWQDGIAFLRGVPATDEGIFRAMAFVGRIAATNYGEVFDVRSVPRPENLAYSDLGLGLHTDNPYRDPVPGFQALHALVTAPDGGESLFADGLALAEHLREVAPGDFARLARTPVPFHYRAAGVELRARRPIIRLACDGAVAAVHYNNRSIAPLPLAADAAERFYRAYRRFGRMLRDTRYCVKLRLRDGDLVVFDNHRVLHGRTAFSSAQHPRHLRGCYLTRDSVQSEAACARRATTGAGRA